MNIFATDRDPRQAARNLDDKRVIKLILESAQMLSTAVHLSLEEPTEVDWLPAIYSPGHVHHPCTKWARETDENYNWLLEHMKELGSIYSGIYGRDHASMALVPFLEKGSKFIEFGRLTKFANCAQRADLGISYTHVGNAIDAYRAYLVERWSEDRRDPTFTGRSFPEWAKQYHHFYKCSFYCKHIDLPRDLEGEKWLQAHAPTPTISAV